MRATQYSYLDEQRHIYLDYTGAGLAASAQLKAHQIRIASVLSGNPHSTNPTSQNATQLIEDTRKRILKYLNASAAEYAVIFTQNATGAARLVGEAYPFTRGSRLILTADNHNSIHGLRQFAKISHARTSYVPIQTPDLCIDPKAISAALPCLKRRFFGECRSGRSLFAYPAQSNFSGVRHPLSWVQLAQDRGYDVLLDAAAYLPTERLDLSVVRPDFIIISWYKLFGFPTGVGCLVTRHSALARLSRPWFSGGTVQASTVGVPWHALSADENAFEDGTLNFLSIPDVCIGLDWLEQVGMDVIKTRIRCLTGWFIDRLQALRHSDGSPMATIYGPTNTKSRGGTVTFNLLNASGKIVDERLVAIEAAAVNISLRTGCFCNPGAGEAALGIGKDTLLSVIRARKRGLVSFDSFIDSMKLQSAGTIRVSFGIASNVPDLDYFFAFLAKRYRDRNTPTHGLPPRQGC